MKKKLSYVLVVALIIATFLKIFKNLNIQVLLDAVGNSHKGFLFLGVICMFIYWGIEAGIIDMLVKKVAPRTRLWTSVKTTIVGQYYSFITPFASGGQPAQLYTLSQDNVDGGKATAVLVGKFLLFQVTVTIYSLMLTLLRVGSLYANLKTASWFIITGLVLNTVGLTLIILMAFKPQTLENILLKAIVVLSRLNIIKSPKEAIRKMKLYIKDYLVSINYMKNDLPNTIYMFVLSLVQVTSFFSVTYFVYRALGLSGASVIDIISLQALLYMAVSFIPIPGTLGASEFGFSVLLGSIFTSNLIAVALLLWRGISYYLGLILCGVLTLLIYLYEGKRGRTREEAA